MTKDELKKINLPDEPGIYEFRDGEGKILYIGKAASLRDRVRSYFATDLAETRSTAIVGMVAKAANITWERVDTVLEALILEAHLIKKNLPPYNIDEKDNKSFNYLVITKEAFPRILVVRGRDLFLKWNEKDIKYCFGPFPHGGALQEAVKMVRRIFPFRDSKCVPAPVQREKSAHPRPCFNRQIGLCPGVCTGEMSALEYKETVKNIVELFSGGMRSLKRRLEKEMKDASKMEDFEKAERLRRQVGALNHVRDVSLIKDEYRVSPGGSFRIEAYDVAHTSGDETVGVMVVVEGGEAYKSGYRMFKIRDITNDDTKSLAQVLERRLAHPEWQYPKLIVIDGGKGQINAAMRVLKKAGVRVPLVAVKKDEFHRPSKIIGDERMAKAYEREILLANSEAHRFAISFHRKRSRRKLM
ncbi:GIY-YIG nuclease family protein [Candidatus Kaiserbacteria bacterium]|nr:GIY-YIG nuclease family protein [Candidatus Kaiserbacteria bacterium]